MSLRISVVIPVAEGDASWRALLPDLAELTVDDEIILSSESSLAEEMRVLADSVGLKPAMHWVPSCQGRARQMNKGAHVSEKEFVWFLHCDSKVRPHVIGKLRQSLVTHPNSVHFFDLKFLKDGPWLTVANGYGAWLRSHFFRLPFGDQGFCMHRDIFRRLGGFLEDVPYGEDHLLIWKTHQLGIKLRPIGISLYTSARRYRTDGWLRTTSRHLTLTAKQAAPEFARLLRSRFLT